jgi:hypothetical protein
MIVVGATSNMQRIITAALMCTACYAQSVTIVNSGSTNTAGFQIVVEKSGLAEYSSHSRRNAIDKGAESKTIRKTIPKSLARVLYEDVKTARPLSSLHPQSCMKSASFGTRLTIQFGDDTSPDLSCGDGGDAKMRALIRDTDAIIKSFSGQ